jgi:glycosyltransferase involved in cell wall biosynthesis
MNNGSKIRIYNLLRGLSQHHDVILLSFADKPEVNPNVPEIRSLCSRVVVVPWKEFEPGTLKSRLAFLSLKPRSIVDTFSPGMVGAIKTALKEDKPDLVIASQLHMAAYYPYFSSVPALFEELEIGLFYDRSFSFDGSIRPRQALTWFKHRFYLSRLLHAFGGCTVVSETERQLVLQNFSRYKKWIEVIPNCVDMGDYSYLNIEKKQNTMIFSGPFKYRVNYEAMQWFVREVFPVILERIPEAKLIITGDHENLPLPSSRNIVLTGYVEDIKSLIASCMVAVAPLQSGGGTRVKILEAMAVGTPVVATSKGAEGLDAQDGVHFLVTDDAKKFAGHVLNLFQDRALHRELVANGAGLVAEKYDWSKVLHRVFKLVERIAAK